MKKFSELTYEQFEEIVNRSKKLRDELDNYIQDTEMYWLEEKLNCVNDSLEKWSVGFFNQNFIRVRDYESFVDGVEESVKCYGSSERLEKKLQQCKKLRGTNLFEYESEKLKELYFKEELQVICDYTEDACYELYCGKVGEKCRSYLEPFFDNYVDCLFDEEERVIYRPQKLDAA